jgi:hypothetical protein
MSIFNIVIPLYKIFEKYAFFEFYKHKGFKTLKMQKKQPNHNFKTYKKRI